MFRIRRAMSRTRFVLTAMDDLKTGGGGGGGAKY